MPKAPLKTEVDSSDLEQGVEAAAAGAINELAPPELRADASSMMQAILQETRSRPLRALMMATALGYVASVLLRQM